MKKYRLLLTLLCCLLLLAADAQKEGNVWHFGMGAALDFNSGTAAISTPSSMWTFEGCASIADADGNLLFYSNGGGRDPLLSGQSSGKIWNRNHQEMYDMGNTEGGGFSAAQSSVIVPKPGDPNHYYLFTMEEEEFEVGGNVPAQPEGRGLSYFDIDMALNGGLGGVAGYTGIVLAPSYEGLCAVRHSNGSDYWIIVHNDTLGLAVFPVNAAGVGAPVFFNFPGGTGGVIKGSPDGKWLSLSRVLFQFDAASGAVSNPLSLLDNANFTEFSPNSKRLFLTTSDNEVVYVDLTSPDIAGSKVSVAQLEGSGFFNAQMQLAPDGKIYFVQVSFLEDSTYLSAIVCPNASPLIESKIFAFNNANTGGFFGLPNFDNAIFRLDVDPSLSVNLGNEQALCTDENLVLDAGIGYATYNWSTGAQTQTLSVNTPGVYAVTVTAPGCGVGVDSVVVNQVTPLRLPNAFTPNGDSINDRFQPIGTAIESYDLTVYNRWGEQVFQGNTAWDGRFEGEEAPCDVYVFLMQVTVCDSVQAFSGDVTLIR